jgi:tRNA(Ser,Leu) C12 N-acetylase TAN1
MNLNQRVNGLLAKIGQSTEINRCYEDARIVFPRFGGCLVLLAEAGASLANAAADAYCAERIVKRMIACGADDDEIVRVILQDLNEKLPRL